MSGKVTTGRGREPRRSACVEAGSQARKPETLFLATLLVVVAVVFLLSMTLQAEDRKKEGAFVPEVAREAANQGNAAFLRKDYPGARKAFEQVLSLVPDSLVGLVNLGLVEFYSGNTLRAEELLKKAVSLRLENPAAWLTLGMIYMDQEKFDDALAALAQAVLQDPRNPRARNYLGVVIGRKGWIDGAQSELRRSVELDPTYADAQYNLAVFYLEEKPPAIELARRHYYRAIELGAEKDTAIEKVLKSEPANR
ncbi:MAG: tetratricopeptide repeat protein [Verrucomicrobiaceae bacterium]|nr:MAG: tetratricopeptide repeat protein [Verrucomicrobiaceae bacterium]